jgi:hypothetical protein
MLDRVTFLHSSNNLGDVLVSSLLLRCLIKKPIILLFLHPSLNPVFLSIGGYLQNLSTATYIPLKVYADP